MNIAFIDEWTIFAEKLNINLNIILDAIKLRPTHSNIRYPGLGVGGYCLTKDPLLPQISSKLFFKNVKNKFLFSSEAVKINNLMPIRLAKIIFNELKKINKRKVLFCGVSYKEDVDDTRDSPSLILYNYIKKFRKDIVFQDSLVEHWKEIKQNTIKKISNLDKYNLIIFNVKDKYYQKLNFKRISGKKVIFDLNNVLSKKQIHDIKKNKKNKFFLVGKGFN